MPRFPSDRFVTFHVPRSSPEMSRRQCRQNRYSFWSSSRRDSLLSTVSCRYFAAALRSSESSSTSSAGGGMERFLASRENSCSFRIRSCLYFGAIHVPFRHCRAYGHALQIRVSRNFLCCESSLDDRFVLCLDLFFLMFSAFPGHWPTAAILQSGGNIFGQPGDLFPARPVLGADHSVSLLESGQSSLVTDYISRMLSF